MAGSKQGQSNVKERLRQGECKVKAGPKQFYGYFSNRVDLNYKNYEP